MTKTISTLAVLLSFPLHAAPVVAVDDDMSSPNYNDAFLNDADSGSNPDDISSAFSVFQATGGNPDEALQIFHSHDVERFEDDPFEPINGDGNTSIQSFFDQLGVSYDPTVNGPIESIAFSLDVLYTQGAFSSAEFYVNDSSFGYLADFQVLSASPNWQTITTGPLSETDIGSLDFSGTDGLRFGFGFSSFVDVTFEAEEFSLLVDNFEVIVNAVPEPSSALMGGLASILLLRRRR